MLYKIFMVIAISTFAAAETDIAERTAVADGFVLNGISGQFSLSEDEKVLFSPLQGLGGDEDTEQSGFFEVLKGGGVIEIIENILSRSEAAKMKVWGVITGYEGKNYAYISYALPIAAVKSPPAAKEIEKTNKADEDDGEPIIPEDILASLSRRAEAIDLPATDVFADIERDSLYANAAGVIKIDDSGRAYFTPDGVGRNIQNKRYYLLENAVLQGTLSGLGSGLRTPKFEITAISSQYKGERCLLLQRVRRLNSYGNLSQF